MDIFSVIYLRRHISVFAAVLRGILSRFDVDELFDLFLLQS